MSTIRKTYDKTLRLKIRDKYTKYLKKINNYNTRDLPTEETKRAEKIEPYLNELIDLHNTLAQFFEERILSVDSASRGVVRQELSDFRLKSLTALNTLGFTTDLPANYDKLERKNIKPIEGGETDNTEILVPGSSLAITQSTSTTTNTQSASVSAENTQSTGVKETEESKLLETID